MKKVKNLVAMCLAAVMVLSIGSVSVFAETEFTDNSFKAINEVDFNISPRIAQYVWVDTDTLNFRSGPGTQYSVLGQVYRNQRLWITYAEYDSNGVDWYKCNDIGGWVCSLYVRYSE